MKRHNEVPPRQYGQFCIPLKARDKPVSLPSHFRKAMESEYATRYLERIGASASPRNLAKVLEFAPIQNSVVTTAWKSRWSLCDAVYIDPFPPDKPKATKDRETRQIIDVSERHNSNSQQASSFGTDSEKVFEIGSVSQTFNELKQRHLYPFNQIVDATSIASLSTKFHSSIAAKHRPWRPVRMNPPTLIKEPDPSEKALKELSQIPTITLSEIEMIQDAFFHVIPFDMIHPKCDPHFKDEMNDIFTSDQVAQLIGFVIHYLYATFFRNLTRTPKGPAHLNDQELGSLYGEMLTLYRKHKVELMAETKGRAVWLPLFLMSIRVSVETSFILMYQLWLNPRSNRFEPTRQHLSRLVGELFDSDGIYSRIGSLETTAEAVRIQNISHHRKSTARRPFFSTSPALQSIIPEPATSRARMILKQNGKPRRPKIPREYQLSLSKNRVLQFPRHQK